MLTLLTDADLYAPQPLGRCDLLLGGGKVLAIEPAGSLSLSLVDAERVVLGGARVIPGLIDGHVHVTGGGGENGPDTRVPPILLSALTTAGVTTCVGVLGTDGTTRTMRSLVAKTLALRAEGLSAYCYTGSYEVPVRTLTGSVRDDIVFIDPIIGVGELAISDHRSSQPTFDEVLRVAADCHVAGLLSGKAGVLHLHLGDGPRGLAFVRRALDESELPARVFHPTHVNRQRWLMEEAIALTQRGVTVDITAFDPEEDGVSVEDVIERWWREGLPPQRLTVSSDGAGCLPCFDAEGRVERMGVGEPATLAVALQTLLQRGVPLPHVLPPFTSNVASALRLRHKGRIERGADADLVILDEAGGVRDVLALGHFMVRDGHRVVSGTFEPVARSDGGKA
ncbi:MAG: beta-aspartyl-peptidase [Myxococcota bacterium]